MLGKLIKNSFKAHASAVYTIYIAMGITGLVMLVLMLINWTRNGESSLGWGMAIKGLAATALCIMAFVGVILTFVAVFGDFSRSMYGKEGHLTMTLPVRASSLLLAKWISGTFWVILSYTTLCLCFFGSSIYLMQHSLSVVEDNEAYYSIYELAKEMLTQLFESMGIYLPTMTVILNVISLYAIGGGIYACVFVLLVYAGITLSHCRPFNKLGKIGALLYFIAGFTVIEIFAVIVTKLIDIHMLISPDAFTFTISQSEVDRAWSMGFGAVPITNPYCVAIMAVVLFLGVAFLIDRKVNVD